MENKVVKNEKNRYFHIDVLKTFAIMFVLFYHGNISPINFETDPSVKTYLNYFIMTIFSTGVPVFFLINGYLLFNRPLDIKRHGIKIVRYITITLIWAVLTICILMPIKEERLSLSEILITLLEWKQGWINHLWFMGALIGIYLIFPLLKTAFDCNKKYFFYFVGICTVMTVGNNLLNMIINVLNWLVGSGNIIDINCFSIFNPFFWGGGKDWIIAYFCIGGLLGYYEEKFIEHFLLKKRVTNIVFAIIISFSCIGLWLYAIFISTLTNNRWDVVWYGYDTIFTFLNVFSIYCISLNFKGFQTKRLQLFIEKISRNTLGIYFLHEIFIQLTIQEVFRIEINRNIIINGIYVIFIEMLCLIVIDLLKKIPLLKKIV